MSKRSNGPERLQEQREQDSYAPPDTTQIGARSDMVPGADVTDFKVADRPVADGMISKASEFRCNWDTRTFAGRAKLVNAMNPGTLELGTEGRVELRAAWYCIYPDEETDEETGELKQFTRTVLISPTGQTFRTTSEHISRKVPAIFALFTPEEVAAGLPIRISERKSRKLGQTYHALELVCPDDESMR